MQKQGVVWSKYILSSSVELLAANQVEGYVLEPLRLCLNVCVPACEHACARDQPQLFYFLGIFGFFFSVFDNNRHAPDTPPSRFLPTQSTFSQHPLIHSSLCICEF